MRPSRSRAAAAASRLRQSFSLHVRLFTALGLEKAFLLGLALVLHVLRQGLRRLEAELPEQIPHAGATPLVLLAGEAAGQLLLRDRNDCGAAGLARLTGCGFARVV
ncbi:hypothetical protein [Streptomyces sp. NPDC014746]|uniref:hypothetical protein n=1 Tax=Streptomyces sp. NPDC014746 TaxID=3364904 RepID=UPI0036FBA429